MRRVLILAIAVSALGLAAPQRAAAWDDSHGVGSVYVDHHVYGPLRAKRAHRRHKSGSEHIHIVSFPYRYHRYTPGGYFAPWHDPRGYGYAWYWRGSSWR